MDTHELEKYKELLTKLKAELESELEQSADDAAPLELNGSMGRVSRGDAMQTQQMALEMKRRREQRMIRVQSAFQRMEQGTYGLCARCQQPIADARLEAFPDSVMCVRCASNKST